MAATVILAQVTAGWAEESKGQEALDFYVLEAFASLSGKRGEDPDALAKANLRLFMLGAKTPEEIARQRRMLVRQDYPDQFIAQYDGAIEWLDMLKAGNGRQAYQLSETFGRRSDAGVYHYLSRSLFRLAKKKEYPLALWKTAEQGFSSEKPDQHLYACWALKRLAEQGDVEAAEQLGQRFMAGNGLPRSDVKALYWYSRAMFAAMADDGETGTHLESARKLLDPSAFQAKDDAAIARMVEASSEDTRQAVQELLDRSSEENLRDVLYLFRRAVQPSCVDTD